MKRNLKTDVTPERKSNGVHLQIEAFIKTDATLE